MANPSPNTTAFMITVLIMQPSERSAPIPTPAVTVPDRNHDHELQDFGGVTGAGMVTGEDRAFYIIVD